MMPASSVPRECSSSSVCVELDVCPSGQGDPPLYSEHNWVPQLGPGVDESKCMSPLIAFSQITTIFLKFIYLFLERQR